jgi:hypothetical protein
MELDGNDEIADLEANFMEIAKKAKIDGEITKKDRKILDSYWNHPIIEKKLREKYIYNTRRGCGKITLSLRKFTTLRKHSSKKPIT